MLMSEHWSKIYVRHVIAEMKTTKTGLARMIGKASTTISRPLADDEYPYNFGRDTLDRIAAATGILYGPFQGDEPMDGEGEVTGQNVEDRVNNLPQPYRGDVLRYIAEREILAGLGKPERPHGKPEEGP